jgi:hypothetical protein
MSRPTVHVATDLSALRLVTPEAASWTAPADLGLDAPDATVRDVRRGVEESAAWLAGRPGMRRRPLTVVVDTEEAICAWVKAPSPAGPVVGAAFHSLGQEWGDRFAGVSIEPLTSPGPRRSLLRRSRKEEDADEELTREPGITVIALRDGPLRLWLDALDRRGVRCAEAMSLWHAAARAWLEPDDVTPTAIVLLDGAHRLRWSWARGHDLLAAGGVELEPHSEDEAAREQASSESAVDTSCRRLSLDWLTWSTQLGILPERMIVVGEGASHWAQHIQSSWTSMRVDCHEASDAIGTTIERLSSSQTVASDTGRQRLMRVTHRPTRATRARYRLAGVAMLLLLVAVSSVAFRLSDKASEWRQQSQSERRGVTERVREIWPDLVGGIRDPLRTAQGQLANERQNTGPEAPDPPQPIFARPSGCWTFWSRLRRRSRTNRSGWSASRWIRISRTFCSSR